MLIRVFRATHEREAERIEECSVHHYESLG